MKNGEKAGMRFSGDFNSLKEPMIDEYIISYMGLDKEKVVKEFGSCFNFVNNFLHNKIFNIDLDMYGNNILPLMNIINGLNKLIESGINVSVLTARNSEEIEGIVAKTQTLVERYVPHASEIIVVPRTKFKVGHIHKADFWIDDDYGLFLNDLTLAGVYITKVQFPKNENLYSHSAVNWNSDDPAFVQKILEYAEKTGKNRLITDLDDTLVSFRGRFREVCDYALKNYHNLFQKWFADEEYKKNQIVVSNKKINYQLLQNGSFGNKLQMWNSLEEILNSNYSGTVSMRYKGQGGGGHVEYEVPIPKIEEIQQNWIKQGAKIELITFNESAPDHNLLVQGEALMHLNSLYLTYSMEKKKMRDAMKNSSSAKGLKAMAMLEYLMSPSSFSDMEALLELFPGHVVEFSTYSSCLGDIPGRNTVIWEVRNY